MSWWRILAIVGVAYWSFTQWMLVRAYQGKLPLGSQHMEPNPNFYSVGWLSAVLWTAALGPVFFSPFPAVLADLLLIWTLGRAVNYLRALNGWHPYYDFGKGRSQESARAPLLREQFLTLSIGALISAGALWRFGWR